MPGPTYHSPDFRTYPPETVTGRAGQPVSMTLCEEFAPESGRWESFYSIRKAGSR